MTTDTLQSRTLDLGTTGWTAADLDDAAIKKNWAEGPYEIVEGVLSKLPPAYYAGGTSLFNLLFVVRDHLKREGLAWKIATELDIVLSPVRVAVADAAVVTPEDNNRQAAAMQATRQLDPQRTRFLVPPTLVVESVSPGYELHDRQTKKNWYAQFGVPNYWLISAVEKKLDCQLRRDGKYDLDVRGQDSESISPSLFPGLFIELAEIW